MKRVQKFVVVPFRSVRGRLQQAEMRPAQSEEAACRLARQMADRFAAVAAFEVLVDVESGEMHEPRELVAYGPMPVIDEAMVA